MAIALFSDERFGKHRPPAGHPERPERLQAIEAAVAPLGLLRRSTRAATRAELERVHGAAFVAELERVTRGQSGSLDPDTWYSPDSWDAAQHAAGASVVAAESVADGSLESAFVLARPPGHHATADRAMGFCLLNNVAVAAAALVERGARVAVFDWDVHHGNGTEAIFAADPRVLYVSTHQWPQYPGTGPADYTGEGRGLGYTLNLPLRAGADDENFALVLERRVAPALAEFAPDVVLVSAGFDAHRDDPVGGLAWTEASYVAATRALRRIQPKLLFVLEGGYDLGATARSCAAVLTALAAG